MASGMSKKKGLKVTRYAAAGVVLVAVVAVNVAAVRFGESLETLIGTDSVKVAQTDKDAQWSRDARLAQDIEGEGLVLTQNKGQTLPLSKDTARVNVFGWASTQWVVGGSGSGGVQGSCEGILDALTKQGISYNEELAAMYRDFQGERPYLSAGTLNAYANQFCRLYEPSIDDTSYYPPSLLDKAKEYSNTALVVLSRMAGESIDCPRNQLRVTTKGGAPVRSANRTYLEPSPEEERLIAYVAANYDNVIVLVNSTNAMELGVVKSIEGVDACMLVGATGTGGATSVVKALWGEINPSGRTVDTYAYDFSTAASWANSGELGEGLYVGSRGLYPADGTANTNVGEAATYSSVRFIDYVEGIYVGYRWYETANAEGYWNDVRNRYGSGYEGVVQYPFGFGLSYTNFSWQIVDRSHRAGTSLAADDTISLTVRVTNTGGRAGKDVVQLYFTAPYTPGGIEKASTNLASFAKTDLLQPGQSQDVTLSFSVRDMASYDCYDANSNGFCGYELEAGKYAVELKTDAHTLADCRGARVTYDIEEDEQLKEDAATGALVANRFTGADAERGISIDGSTTGQKMSHLSRADFAGTFPRVRDLDRETPDAIALTNLYDAAQAAVEDEAANAREATTGGASDADTTRTPLSSSLVAENGELTDLGRYLGRSYDDVRWDALLDEIAQDDMERVVLHGYSSSGAIEKIGKEKTKDLDGPAQVGSFHQLQYGVGFPNPTVLAQTWNISLSRSYGQAAGMEAAMLGIDGWYAPACNIHRTPLGGRNYEYYSEDPLVSGKMAAQAVCGARETGTFTYLKHLILNDQDSYRDSLYTWLTEQALREVYLEPFRVAVQEGGATGMMSSYGRIGAVWTGGSKALLTGVLREEWGFDGAVITDYSDHHQYMNADEMLRAGGSLLMDGVFRDGEFRFGTDSANFAAQLRRATKDIIYTWLNARETNLAYNENAAATGAAQLVRPIKEKGVSPVMLAISVVDAVAVMVILLGGHRYLQRRKNAPSALPNEENV